MPHPATEQAPSPDGGLATLQTMLATLGMEKVVVRVLFASHRPDGSTAPVLVTGVPTTVTPPTAFIQPQGLGSAMPPFAVRLVDVISARAEFSPVAWDRARNGVGPVAGLLAGAGAWPTTATPMVGSPVGRGVRPGTQDFLTTLRRWSAEGHQVAVLNGGEVIARGALVVVRGPRRRAHFGDPRPRHGGELRVSTATRVVQVAGARIERVCLWRTPEDLERDRLVQLAEADAMARTMSSEGDHA